MTTPWYETRTYADGITRVRERFIDGEVRCNMWHIRGRDRDVLVDTGFGLRPLRDEIAALRERPVLAVASHSHFDHVGGHYQFDERLVHPAEAHILAAPTDDNTVWRGWETGSVVLAEPEPGFDQLQWHVPAAPATRTLFTGDVIYDGELYDWLYHSDREQYRETLARVRELPADTFHCGHEESFGRDRLIDLVDAYLERPPTAKR